jgi:S1-C subfamily serine protease
MSLNENIQKIKNSIVAIGIKMQEDQINIIGSGFCVIDNFSILTAAHLFQNFKEEQINKLGCLVANKDNGKVVSYVWKNLELKSKEVENDACLLRLKEEESSLLKPIEVDFSESFSEGTEVYYIGFPYATNLLRDGFGVTLIVNKGIISSVKRKAIGLNPLDWLIIDGISNPGNSGCPLIDLNSNKAIGIMSISFRIQSQVNPALDIREPMHIAGAKPISLLAEGTLKELIVSDTSA